MAEFNLDALVEQLDNASAAGAQSIGHGIISMRDTVKQMTDLFTGANAGEAQAVAIAQEVAGNKAAINYQQNKLKEDTQRLYRFDAAAPDYYVAEQMAKVEAAESAQAPVRAEYDRLRQIDLVDNPLGWIFAQVQLPQVSRQNNALVDQEEAGLARINARAASLQAVNSVQVANTADAVRANELRAAEGLSALSQSQLQQKAGENAARIGATKMQAISLEKSITDDLRASIQAKAALFNADETRKMRKAAEDAAQPQRELARLQLQSLIDKRKLDAEDEARMNASLQIVSDTMGLRVPMTMDTLRRMPDGKKKSDWLQAALEGQFGGNVQDAVVFYQSNGNMDVVRAAGGASIVNTAKKLDQAGAQEALLVGAAEQAKTMSQLGYKVPTAEVIRAAGYKQYEVAVGNSTRTPGTVTDLSNPVWDTKYNPYVAPFLTTAKMIDTDPNLAGLKNNVVKQQIDILAKAGVLDNRENLSARQQKDVMRAIELKVADRKITPQQAAADIHTFISFAAQANQEFNQYQLFGLPTQDAYLFTMPGDRQRNLFDKTELENSITNSVRTILKERQNIPFISGFPSNTPRP